MSSIDAEALYRALLEQIRAVYGEKLGAGQDGAQGAVLAGIYSGGAWLAERLARDLNLPSFGVVNVALHRDDYAKKACTRRRARPRCRSRSTSPASCWWTTCSTPAAPFAPR